MDEYRAKPGSLLHRLLGLAPGYAPAWLCSRDLGTGFDLLVVADGIALLGGIWATQRFGWFVGGAAIGALAAFLLFVHVPFDARERLGRARRRLGECVWCGRLAAENGVQCPCRDIAVAEPSVSETQNSGKQD